MKFDKIIQHPCTIESPEEIACPIDIPSTDEQCADLAFALANPELCKFYPVLKIKPEITTICTGSDILFKTYIYSNGVEMELTEGVVYTSSNRDVVVIGGLSGNASGVAEGIVSISVTWQNLSAHAQLTVMPADACCETLHNGFQLLLDNSASMGVGFSAQYSSKLSYVKLLATEFAQSVDLVKDYVGVFTFNESPTRFGYLDKDLYAIEGYIAVTTVTGKKTNIYDALVDTIAYMTSAGLGRRVIVLFSDGEVRPDDPRNPVPIAQAFKEQGGTIIVVGIRAYGAGFDLLSNIASSGFFLNAFSSNQAEVFDLLVGLKGYICGGECPPPGDSIDSHGQLNWPSFVNWDVTGKVDLIGEGTGGDTLFDLLPGNGLYVDLCGTAGLGHIRSKAAFTFTAGQSYKLSYSLAGNQRENRADSVNVTIGTLLDVVRSFDESQWILDFQEYTNTFIGDGGTYTVAFEQGDIGIGWDAAGNLLDNVKLENLTTGELLLLDTFDSENRYYVPPSCGSSYYGGTSYYGYDCYGCLGGPIPVQKPDPNESVDVESSEPPPVRYTSTQEYTAECESPSVGDDVTKSASASSSLSQADADSKALAEARALAEAALNCSTPSTGTAITIPSIGAASPYPSIIAVSGMAGTIKKVTVQITGLTHSYPRDVDILLISPTGKTVLLMSDCGNDLSLSAVNILIDDSAPGSIPELAQIVSGSYKPTNYGATDNHIAPAPPSPYGSLLSSLIGLNPNGSWYLYVVDDTDLDGGSITSWALNITT